MTITEDKMTTMMDRYMVQIQSMLDTKVETIKTEVRDLKEDLSKKHEFLHNKTEQLQNNDFVITERQNQLENELRQLKQAYSSLKDEIDKSMDLRMIEFKKELSKGNSSSRNHILWVRGLLVDNRGKPVDLRRVLGNDIPKLFWTICSGATRKGKLDFTFNIRKGYT